jgi:short-subunit dehydrogenase
VSLPAPVADRLVLVTGASSGIGAELARVLAQRGHDLAIVARRRERLEELAVELRESGVGVDVHACDLADRGQRRALIAAIEADGRALAGLCNNAGFGIFGRFWQIEAEREAEQVELNVVALHELTRALLPGMVQRGEGAILNLGSVAGFQPIPGNATYAATKAFVNSFSEALHAELAGTGVSCTVVCPGPVATEFAEIAGVGHVNDAGGRLFWATAREVAERAVKGMENGRRTVMPRQADRAASIGGRYAPRTVLLPALRLGSRALRRR